MYRNKRQNTETFWNAVGCLPFTIIFFSPLILLSYIMDDLSEGEQVVILFFIVIIIFGYYKIKKIIKEEEKEKNKLS